MAQRGSRPARPRAIQVSGATEFKGEPMEAGFGTVATMVLPGALEVTLYQPRHPTAI